MHRYSKTCRFCRPCKGGRPLINNDNIPEYLAKRTIKADRGYSSPCWIWQLYLTEKGYGRTGVPILGERRVHRIAYVALKGPIPVGLTLDHLCRVKACCNPDHLEPVTDLENRRRAGQITEAFALWMAA